LRFLWKPARDSNVLHDSPLMRSLKLWH